MPHTSTGIAVNGAVSANEIRLFETIPGNNALLQVNPPQFTILAVTDGYLHISGKTRQELIGQGIFDVFPSNPHDPTDTGEKDLRSSFDEVIKTGSGRRFPHNGMMFQPTTACSKNDIGMSATRRCWIRKTTRQAT